MGNRKVRLYTFLVSAILIVGLIIASCAPKGPEATKESIKVGFSAPISGSCAVSLETIMDPYTYWAESINQEGGLYVKDLGRKIPIELVYYDDKSTPEKAVEIYEKLITVDKCDLLLPPWGTAWSMAILQIAENYKYPITHATCCSTEMLGLDADYNWEISGACTGETSVTPSVDLASHYVDVIGNKVAVLYEHSPWSLESAPFLEAALQEGPFDIVEYKDFAWGMEDMSEVLIDVKSKNPDIFILTSYVEGFLLTMRQSMEIGFDADIYWAQLGPGISTFKQIFGEATEGIMGSGWWCRGGPGPGSTEFWDGMCERFGYDTLDATDPCLHYAACQILEQAVEKAGTLDREAIRDTIDTETFTTIMGPVYFGGNILNTEGINATGGVVQIINGRTELVWPPEFATAEPLIPKPAWPK